MSNSNVIKSLSKLLADSYTLYLKTQNFHWNVTGPNFHSLHTMFEEQYPDLDDAVDVIAERIRALGEYAPAAFSLYNEDHKGWIPSNQYPYSNILSYDSSLTPQRVNWTGLMAGFSAGQYGRNSNEFYWKPRAEYIGGTGIFICPMDDEPSEDTFDLEEGLQFRNGSYGINYLQCQSDPNNPEAWTSGWSKAN